MTISTLIKKVDQDNYIKSDLQKWVKALPKHEPLKPVILSKIKSDEISKKEILKVIHKSEWVDKETAMVEVKNVISEIKPQNGIPTKYKKGDTLMHPIFRHPYVLMEQKDGSWICGLLTSESECNEILEKCRSRFFAESYFTKVIFTVEDPIGTYMFPFDNGRQINKVLKELKNIFK